MELVTNLAKENATPANVNIFLRYKKETNIDKYFNIFLLFILFRIFILTQIQMVRPFLIVMNVMV